MVVGWISCFLVSRVEADQSISQGQEAQVPIYFIQANPEPPDKGTPLAREGTGTRGDCLYKAELPPLHVLVGIKNLYSTVSDYPTFWIYIPYTSEDAPSGEFSFWDNNGKKDLYRKSFKLPDQQGFVGIRLPKTETPLEVGQTYLWNIEIKINCPSKEASNQSPRPVDIQGAVRRVAQSPDLERELNQAKTTLETIAVYDKYDIWYDHLNKVAELMLQQPHDSTAETAWNQLMEQLNNHLLTIQSSELR
ncbi:MAG: DUF928 domain-containing protein [Moorea sp. SIO3C2]|nr:DUF928 domain-containing protein [Moorena sp. SIO3C2]